MIRKVVSSMSAYAVRGIDIGYFSAVSGDFWNLCHKDACIRWGY